MGHAVEHLGNIFSFPRLIRYMTKLNVGELNAKKGVSSQIRIINAVRISYGYSFCISFKVIDADELKQGGSVLNGAQINTGIKPPIRHSGENLVKRLQRIGSDIMFRGARERRYEYAPVFDLI